MKQQIEVLSRLGSLRGNAVRQMLGRVTYQQNLCQRYRNNITGLSRLCSFTVPMTTPLQRDNQHRYKASLHAMVQIQRRELEIAEEALERIQQELFAAMRSEKAVTVAIDTKMAQWQELLGRQEQKLQDGLATQAWLHAHRT